MHFADRLNKAIKEKGTPICVGLDPYLERIPESIKRKAVSSEKNPWVAAAEAILEFNKGIIDAVCDLVATVKPQISLFEQYGSEGMRVFAETVKYAKEKGLLVIADAKRSDIGVTAEAYARAFLGKVDFFGEELFGFDADAVTVNPYMGYDSVKPFIEQCKKFDKGIFVLVKTSNRSSGDLQDVISRENNIPNYELVGHLVESWGANDIGESGYSSVGAVVGATFPEQAKKLRSLMPNTIFLVPGYGAQGAGASDVRDCFNADGSGAIINSSRGIIFAYETMPEFGEEGFAEASRVAVLQMKEEIARAR